MVLYWHLWRVINNLKSVLVHITIIFAFLTVTVTNSVAFPKEMPDDFSIHYSFSGGMSPTYKTILLRVGESQCGFRMNFDDPPTEYTFTLSKEELNVLYNELNTIHAFTLKSKKTKVYDRGGESIGYTISNKNYNVSNSGMNFIIGPHSKTFTKSVLLITTLAAKYQP